MTPFRRVLTGAVLFLITIIVATAGYMIAGWTFLDAIYQVVITVFGVGFGEVNPITTPVLRLFTMLVIIGGTSSAVYAVGGIVQMITEGEINRALGVRRMLKAIETLENHTIICGFGRMGQILARELTEKRKPFVVIDNDPARVIEAQELSYLVISGNATDEEVLELAGIQQAGYLATVLPDDAANVFITLTARGMNPLLSILARGEYPSTERKLRLAGANHVVLPATICAMRMSQMITHPASLDLLNRNDGSSTLNELLGNLDMQLDELRVSAGSALIGSFVKDLEVRSHGQVGRTYLIVALRRSDGTLIMNPGSTVALHEDDTVIVMGHKGDMPKLAEELSLKRQIRYRGAKL